MSIKRSCQVVMNFQKDSLSNRVFKALRDEIVFVDYPPGMSLSEKELCKSFKVSRTPLREAIRRLEEINLVTITPRYGTYISQVEINEIRCAFEMKIKLETLAGEVASKRITADKLEELHTLILSLLHCKRLRRGQPLRGLSHRPLFSCGGIRS